MEKIILQKYIASNAHYSRRQAEELIREGRVVVNGKSAELGQRVDESDEVVVSGKEIGGEKNKKEKIYLKMNKPMGYVCTNKSFKGERNVFDLIDTRERLFVVGRLDKESRGLIVLTNDGTWAQEMSHPKYECEKTYLAHVFYPKDYRLLIKDDNTAKEIIEKFKEGIDIGDDDGVVWAKDVKYMGKNTFKVVLTFGKKRQIRRMFQRIGLQVKELERVAMGKVTLGNLKEGRFVRLTKGEIGGI